MGIFDYKLPFPNTEIDGIPVTVYKMTPKRTHRKKRRHKKWLKRYGYHPCKLDSGSILYLQGRLFMNEEAYKKLSKNVKFINRGDCIEVEYETRRGNTKSSISRTTWKQPSL